MAAKKGASVAASGGQAALSFLRLTIPAGKATPSPPIGPALGQRGVNIMDFCKQFNERTKTYILETPIPTVISINPKDKSFTFMTRTPPVTFFLKQAAGVSKGSAANEIVGTVTLQQIFEIAKLKQGDANLSHLSLEAISNNILGTARTMGIQVVKGVFQDKETEEVEEDSKKAPQKASQKEKTKKK